jgi:hypothetical protein
MSKVSMFQVKKDLGNWTVQTVSNGKVMFRSGLRSLARDWKNLNEPIPAAAQLNASIGKDVWRARPSA